jgi:hypothetical protein
MTVLPAAPAAVVSEAKTVIRDEYAYRLVSIHFEDATKNWEAAAREVHRLHTTQGGDETGFLRRLEANTISKKHPTGIPITSGFRLLHAGRALAHGYKGIQQTLEHVGQLLSRDDTTREEIDRALEDGNLDDLFWRKTGRGLPRVQLKARIRELDRQILAVVKGINPRAKGPDSRELVYEFAASHPQEFSVFVQEHAPKDGAE